MRIIWTDIIDSFQSRGDTYGHRDYKQWNYETSLSKLHMVYKYSTFNVSPMVSGQGNVMPMSGT